MEKAVEKSVAESVKDELDYLESLKSDRPDLYPGELGRMLASAVSGLSVNKLGSQEYLRGNELLLSLIKIVDEVSQDPKLSPKFLKAFTAQLKASLSHD